MREDDDEATEDMRTVICRLFEHVVELRSEVRELAAQSCAMQAQLSAVQQTMEAAMAALDDQITQLTTQVKANTDAEDSAAIVLNKIPQFIADAIAKATAAGATPAQLQALTDLQTTLKAHADPLAAAVVSGTPAA